MRRMAGLLAVGLVAVACAGEAAEMATTSSAPAAEAPTPAVLPVGSTTTTEAMRPTVVEIPGRGLQWDVGATYVTDQFLVVLEFRPQEEGWSSLGADTELVYLSWSGRGTEGITVTVAAHLPFEPIEVVAQSIVDAFDVVAESEPVEAVVGGWSALSVDVKALPNRVPQDSECDFETGRLQVAPDRYALGFGSCSVSRVWVVEVGDTAVTVVGSTFETERFDELIGRVERLLASTEFVES